MLRGLDVMPHTEKRRMTVDLKESDMKDISIGDIVTVVVKGKVKSLDAGMKPSAEEKEEGFYGFPPDMSIEITSTKVTTGNDFAELAED